MKPGLIVAIWMIACMPLCAEAQQPDAAKAKAAAQKDFCPRHSVLEYKENGVQAATSCVGLYDNAKGRRRAPAVHASGAH